MAYDEYESYEDWEINFDNDFLGSDDITKDLNEEFESDRKMI